MTDRNTTDYIASAAYDQGFEAGVRQERERIKTALLSDGAVEAMLNAANRKGHLFPKRDPQSLPDSYAFRRQRLDICKRMGQAAIAAIGLGEEGSNE